MCYHLDGFVQKYAVYKTEDLPNLSPDCKFSPAAVRDMAKNVLAFLKQKATQVSCHNDHHVGNYLIRLSCFQEGHTYWLFKGKDEETVKVRNNFAVLFIVSRKWISAHTLLISIQDTNSNFFFIAL